ncbi:hypothetical protein NBO_38g0010 [Nosema bombycis CQ1]|uniref:Uncharacterized protein n=1 Tax=Nosema bombycis (strain CQ1 / CVCC 102059) TaxID=578461 RepID=R0M7X5_NOSB1|nr:hypothetical protein NBO_38g0010 [Nosema bombycis CQ1]|eukprot:EOB14099.1 hypothetical protein NBO_38g0010 [Nosema bombycis CQ1]
MLREVGGCIRVEWNMDAIGFKNDLLCLIILIFPIPSLNPLTIRYPPLPFFPYPYPLPPPFFPSNTPP